MHSSVTSPLMPRFARDLSIPCCSNAHERIKRWPVSYSSSCPGVSGIARRRVPWGVFSCRLPGGRAESGSSGQCAQYLGRYAASDNILGDVAVYDRAIGDHAVVANGYAFEHGDIRADKHIRTDADGLALLQPRAAQAGFEAVEVGVVGREVVADQGVVANADAAALGNQHGVVVEVAVCAYHDLRCDFPGLDVGVAVEEERRWPYTDSGSANAYFASPGEQCRLFQATLHETWRVLRK